MRPVVGYLVFETLDAGPSAQHEWVVCRNHGNDVDAFRLQLFIVPEIPREVVHMTGRLSEAVSRTTGDRARAVAYRERAGNGKDDDLLVGPLFRNIVFGG